MTHPLMVGLSFLGYAGVFALLQPPDRRGRHRGDDSHDRTERTALRWEEIGAVLIYQGGTKTKTG